MHDDQPFSSPDPEEELDSEPIQADTQPTPPPEPLYPVPPEIIAIQQGMHTNPEPEVTADFDFAPPSEETQLRIQEALKDLGHYRGKLNGKWGDLTIFGIQTIVAPQASREWNASRKAGVPDRELCLLILRSAGYTTESATLSETAWSDFADWLEDGAK